MVNVVKELVARIPPGCTESHCPTAHAVPAGEPATPVIQTINTRVPPDDAPEVCMQPSAFLHTPEPERLHEIKARLMPGAGRVCAVPSLGLTFTVNRPIEPLAGPVHDERANLNGEIVGLVARLPADGGAWLFPLLDIPQSGGDPIKPVCRIVHHELTVLKNQPADNQIETVSVLLQREDIDIGLKLEVGGGKQKMTDVPGG